MKLSNVEIQNFSNELENNFSSVHISKDNQIRMRLSLEESLLRYKDIFGTKTDFTYHIKKRFFSLLVEISIDGKSIDVLHPEGDKGKGSNMLDELFNSGDCQILYNYRNGKNIISVSIPFESPSLQLIGSASLHAIVLGIIIGFLLKQLPEESITVLTEDYISPIYSTMMSCLKGLMEPVIFISLVIGICVFDDLKTLSTIGKRTLLSFLKISTFMFLLAVVTCLFVFPSNGGYANGFNPADIVDLLLTSVPTNIVAPFYEGNMVQIVVLGFVSGVVILVLGEKASSIRQLVLEAKFFLFEILQAFTKLLPVAVFLSVLKVILTTSVSDSAIVWKIIVTDQVLVALVAITDIFVTSLRTKTSMKVLAKKMLPLFNTSFVTGSSTATIPEFYKRLPDEFGIDDKYTNYWIPLSNAFFSPSTIMALIVYAFFSAQMQGVGISITWLIILYIMIIQIGMATPRVPGGIIASCTILFSQLGLTTDQLGIIMAANVLILYFDTAVAAIIRCCSAINVAYKQNCIDLDKLRQ